MFKTNTMDVDNGNNRSKMDYLKQKVKKESADYDTVVDHNGKTSG